MLSFRIPILWGLHFGAWFLYTATMAVKNKGGRPRLEEPLDQMVPVRFTRRQMAVLDEARAGMGMDRSALIRALALTALEGGRGVCGGEPRREGRAEGEPRVTVPPVPQTVFMPLPPGMEPEMVE